MTTQQPTQPEVPESPLSDRVSRLEAIAEETHLRLAENHADHQSLRAEILALSDKVDRQGEALNAKIDRLGETLNAKIDAKIEALRAEMHRQTYMILGAFGTVWATTVGAVVAVFLAM